MAYRTISIKPSSNVAAAQYNEETKDLLITWVRDNRRGIYHEVDANTVEQLSRAPSAGKFAYYFLRGVFPYEEI